MYVDLQEMELKYVINDKDYGKALDIPKGIYRVGVAMGSGCVGLKLLSYNTK